MQVKEADSLAKQYIKDVFVEEDIDNPGLEEIEFDDKTGIWSVTIGFSRPLDEAAGPLAVKLAAFCIPYRLIIIVSKFSFTDLKPLSTIDRLLYPRRMLAKNLVNATDSLPKPRRQYYVHISP